MAEDPLKSPPKPDLGFSFSSFNYVLSFSWLQSSHIVTSPSETAKVYNASLHRDIKFMARFAHFAVFRSTTSSSNPSIDQNSR
jgi:hypothetical protein